MGKSRSALIQYSETRMNHPQTVQARILFFLRQNPGKIYGATELSEKFDLHMGTITNTLANVIRRTAYPVRRPVVLGEQLRGHYYYGPELSEDEIVNQLGW